MKNAANAITAARLLLAGILVLLIEHRTAFFTVYLLCGLTDVLDGVIARKTNTQSALGARLDSVADILMFAVAFAACCRWFGEEAVRFLPFILAAGFLRLTAMVVAGAKYRVFVLLHTWGNKLTGLLVFLIPLFFILTGSIACVYPALLAAFLSGLEELAIHLASKTLDVNRKSIFIPKEAE